MPSLDPVTLIKNKPSEQCLMSQNTARVILAKQV